MLVALEEAEVEFTEMFSPADCDACGAKGSALMTARLTPLGASAVGGKADYAATCSSCFSRLNVFTSPTTLLANPKIFHSHKAALLERTECDLPRWCRAV